MNTAKLSVYDAGIPNHLPELREHDGPDPQWWYVDSVGIHEDARVGHFVKDSDATATLELPTWEQAMLVNFALNNPKRMRLMMQMCGLDLPEKEPGNLIESN